MLSVEEKTSLLRNVSSFHELNEKQLIELADLCKEKTFSLGDVIFQQGEMGGEVYIVVDGKVAIEREIKDRSDSVSIMFITPYDSLGEMSLFYDAPNSVTATAMKETRTLFMKNDSFIEFAKKDPELLVELCEVLSKRLFEAYAKISEITSEKKPLEMRKLYDKLDF
ncbi:MAG: cyclic nucleotide-binding domain-containing protein [Anaerolineales bacterium]|nr:cyclic nucleotide-binding domain-containing protein [Chloroflexota bacterium]MBL6980023.1 cyclic nucleotide-binding domain-containing protein [Anaerolineales bacterium]